MKDVFQVERSLADSGEVKHALAVPMLKTEVVTPAASEAWAKSLTVVDSGKTYVINAAASGCTAAFKLPTPEAGLWFKFYIADTGSNDVTITCTSDGDSAANIGFHLGDVASSVYSVASAADVYTFGASSNNHTIGDWLEVFCDGTNWWGKGHAVVASSFTLA